jgi:hypothetical protein
VGAADDATGRMNDTHGKLHSIDFIERRRVREKVKREGGKENQHSLGCELSPRIVLLALGRCHCDQRIPGCSGIDSHFNCLAAARNSCD